MMKRLFFLALLLAAFSVSSRAQVPIIDSLQAVLRSIPVKSDTANLRRRAKLLDRLAFEYGNPKNGQIDLDANCKYARQSLPIFQQLNDQMGMRNALYYIANWHQYHERTSEAIDTFLVAFKLMETMHDTVSMAKTAANIASKYFDIENMIEQAGHYSKMCMDLSRRANRPHGQCACQAMVGSYFIEVGQLDSAERHTREALSLAQKIGSTYAYPSLFRTMSEIERHRNNLPAERNWLLENERFLIQNADSQPEESLINCWNDLFKNALDQNDLPQARQYQKKIAPKISSITNLAHHDRYFLNLSRLAERENRPADALFYFKKHIEARDSVNNLDKTRRITQIQMTHDFEKKQAVQAAAQSSELALRDARVERQRLLFGLVLLGLLGGGAFWIYANRQKQNRQRTELELANLRAQINPHFIFNCLNSIYRYTKERDTDTASKYLQKFSSLLRLVLENSRSEKITLGRDLEALQQYADIEGLRFKEKLRFSVDLDPEIDPTFLQIPGMLIQPHVENAIWHGLMHRETGGEIVVRLRQPAENRLRVEIEDNGIGRAAAAELESKSALTRKSLGQKITDQRLRAAGKLAHSETIDLFDADGKAAGTRIVLEIPL